MKRIQGVFCCAAAIWLSMGAATVVWAQTTPAPAPESADDPSEQPVAEAPQEACRCLGDADSATTAKIRQALAGPIMSAGLEFTDTPLEEVISQLQDDYDIPIQLDTPALDTAGVGPAEPVYCSIRNTSLKSALRLMLRSINLTYIIRDEVLMITTPEEAESELQVCVYDIRDLMAVNNNAEQQCQATTILDSITSCVATESWAKNEGGEAEIRFVPPNLLVISQTQDVHEAIGELLAHLRAMHN
jgi:hypothetical protein